MSREDLGWQLNEDIPVKTSVHQVWLKSQLGKKGYFVAVKKRMTQRGFGILSFMNVKKLIPLMGIALLAVLAVVLWNPLVQKLGGKPTLTYAQEMLKLTRKQYDALSPEERQKLAQSVQDGNLEKVWEEAEKAQDLLFLQGNELMKVYNTDMGRILHTDTSNAQQISGFDSKLNGFRYTDPQGKVAYILITSSDSPKNSFVSLQVTKFNFDSSSFPEYIPLSNEQKKLLIDEFNRRIKKKFPDLWSQLQSGSQYEVVEPELEKSDIPWWTTKIADYFSFTKLDFGDMLEMISSNDDIAQTEIKMEIKNGQKHFYAYPTVIVKFKDQSGKKYWIQTDLDPQNSQKIIRPLTVFTAKDEIK